MTKLTRSLLSGLDLHIMAALAALTPSLAAPFALRLTSGEDTAAPAETDEEKKAREEKEKEETAKKKAKTKAEGEDDDDKEDDDKMKPGYDAKAARPPLSACLSAALTALKGGTPALAAAALSAEQKAHAATASTLTQTQADLATAKASLTSTETALAAVCGFFGIKPADIAGLSAEKVHSTLQAKISASAAEIVAGIGIDPAALPAQATGDGQPSTRAELLQAYNAIKDPKAAAAFYAKHEKQLLGN